MRQSAFGAGEVDEVLGVLQALVQVRGDDDTACDPQVGGGIGPQGRAARDVKGAGQARVRRVLDGFDQHAPHAARCARDRDGVVRGGWLGRSGGAHAGSR